MKSETLLHQVDRHIVSTGTQENFVPAPDTTDTAFTQNYLALMKIVDEILAHFPHTENDKCSETLDKLVRANGLNPDRRDDRFVLSTVATDTRKVVEATSAAYAIPLFTKDPLPEKPGYFSPGWAFTAHLGSDQIGLGRLVFERDFAKKITNVSEHIRLGSSVYAAGNFFAEIELRVGDIANAIDMPPNKRNRLVINSFLQATQAQYGFYVVYKAFIEAIS